MKIMRFLCILGLLLTGTTTFAADGDMIVNGKIGVGTASPSTPLEVNGVIKSTTGGIQFPDNTTQTSAIPSNCTTGQIPKWNGTQWACAADDSGGSGTVNVYRTSAGCANSNALSTSATCTSLTCGGDYEFGYTYYSCGGGCGMTSAQTCSNTYVGKLVP
jgi:hypothetical protein